ncbi:hypothetical protein DPMN_042041 [Dreissena polymorpha]|uniref:Uncharacterized protein n=1 Tax=Dreissena polymorpha TaxID=45954 RepID=A0A9D4CXZ8_DREPO|nr:hypothetical protein DPMN_042041 [Dreissena polymorpha]
MSREEGSESRCLLLGTLDTSQNDLIVVNKVCVHLEMRVELDKNIAQAGLLGVPVEQTALQVVL